MHPCIDVGSLVLTCFALPACQPADMVHWPDVLSFWRCISHGDIPARHACSHAELAASVAQHQQRTSTLYQKKLAKSRMMCISTLWASCAGVQLVKMTPFRANISIFFCLQTVAILSIVGLKGGVISYAAVSHSPLNFHNLVFAHLAMHQHVEFCPPLNVLDEILTFAILSCGKSLTHHCAMG